MQQNDKLQARWQHSNYPPPPPSNPCNKITNCKHKDSSTVIPHTWIALKHIKFVPQYICLDEISTFSHFVVILLPIEVTCIHGLIPESITDIKMEENAIIAEINSDTFPWRLAKDGLWNWNQITLHINWNNQTHKRTILMLVIDFLISKDET